MRLYYSLKNVVDFIESMDNEFRMSKDEVRQRREAAVVRFIAELPAPDFFAIRHDWRRYLREGADPKKPWWYEYERAKDFL